MRVGGWKTEGRNEADCRERRDDEERSQRVNSDRDGERERKRREREERMQSDAPHAEPNRDSSVSVATVEKLIAWAFYFFFVRGVPALPASVPHYPALLCRLALVWPLFVVVAKEL